MDELGIRVDLQGARQATNELDGLGGGFRRLRDDVGDASRRLHSMNREAAETGRQSGVVGAATKRLALTVAGAFAGASVTSTVFGEADEARRAAGATESVLRSTGGAANVTAEDVGNLANAISMKTGIDDEQIQSQENLLLTFAKVRNEVGKGNDIFDQATQTAVDLGARFDMGPKQSAIMLGKALQDPIKGMTALGRAGVSFSADQQKAIKAMVQSGNLLAAQKLILAEVNTQVAGAAAAEAQPVDMLRNAYNNLAETIGVTLAPSLGTAMMSLATFITQMQTGEGAGGRFVDVLELLWNAVKLVARWVGEAWGALKKLWGIASDLSPILAGLATAILVINAPTIAGAIALGVYAAALWAESVAAGAAALATWALNAALAVLASPILLIIALIAGIVVGLVVLWHKSEGFRDAMRNVWETVKNAAVDAWNWIRGAWTDAKAWLTNTAHTIKRAFSGIWDGFKGGAKSAINFVIGLYNKGFDLINSITPGEVKVMGRTVIPAIPDIPHIPMLASGGAIRRGGAAIVGERGPELVNLPTGSTVYDAAQTAAAIAGQPSAVRAVVHTRPGEEWIGDLLGMLLERIDFEQAVAAT